MRLSVVMPSFNSGKYIAPAVRSVLSQDGPEVEVVVQDNCSTDGTPAVVADLGDPRVRFTSEPDGGQSDALNKAIARARGEWILWLNADDELAEGALADVQDALSDENELVYGNFAWIDPGGRCVKEYVSSELGLARLLLRGCYIFSGATFVRRDVFDRFGGYDPELAFAMDFDFLARIAGHVRAFQSRRVLAHFRIHSEAKTSSHTWPLLREDLVVRRRYAGHDPKLLGYAATGQARATGYHLLRPLWQSPSWQRLRSARKRL
jgi:glycosyltransferase involved in cell wall biosynthesis